MPLTTAGAAEPGLVKTLQAGHEEQSAKHKQLSISDRALPRHGALRPSFDWLRALTNLHPRLLRPPFPGMPSYGGPLEERATEPSGHDSTSWDPAYVAAGN